MRCHIRCRQAPVTSSNLPNHCRHMGPRCAHRQMRQDPQCLLRHSWLLRTVLQIVQDAGLLPEILSRRAATHLPSLCTRPLSLSLSLSPSSLSLSPSHPHSPSRPLSPCIPHPPSQSITRSPNNPTPLKQKTKHKRNPSLQGANQDEGVNIYI